MKKTIILLRLVLSLGIFGCEYGYDDEIEIGRIEDYWFENDIPEFNSIQKTLDFEAARIEEEKDLDVWGIEEYWQTPEETYSLKTGDCEDFCLLFMYILKNKFKPKFNSELIIIDRNIEYHAIVYIIDLDQYIEVAGHAIIIGNPEILESKIVERIPYEEALWMTMYYHKPIGKYEF